MAAGGTTEGKRKQMMAGGIMVLALTVLAACGDDGDRADPEGSEDPTTTAPPDDNVDPVEDDAVPIGADVEVRPSRGCGSSTVEPGVEEITQSTGAADDGEPRWYIRAVPAVHDGEVPLPLVVDLHGYAEGATVHATATDLGALGEEEGFVTLTPHGEGVGDLPLWFSTPGSRDVEWLGHVLDDAEDDLCLDTARFYITGLSNGARMTSTLACELSDRVAAVAPVAGVGYIEDCAAERPVPVMSFHGTADDYLLYEGGTGAGADSLPRPDPEDDDVPDDDAAATAEVIPAVEVGVEEAMARWAERNDCAADPDEQEVADDIWLLEWECAPGADVRLYRIEGGGHTWPGSEFFEGLDAVVGSTTMAISANELMWSFFQEHALGAEVVETPVTP